jgi:hypothetical protein
MLLLKKNTRNDKSGSQCTDRNLTSWRANVDRRPDGSVFVGAIEQAHGAWRGHAVMSADLVVSLGGKMMMHSRVMTATRHGPAFASKA